MSLFEFTAFKQTNGVSIKTQEAAWSQETTYTFPVIDLEPSAVDLTRKL